MLKHFLRACVLLLPLGAATAAGAATLTVALAANVQYAFEDLRQAFRQQTGNDLQPVIGSSGKLSAQVMNSAPFDVFLSADMDYPDKLYAAGYATAAPKPYAYGALVLWTMNDLDLSDWQHTLTTPGVAKIAVANPRTAPYGRETLNLLRHFKLEQALQPKLVFGDSIAQTSQYIHSKAADAGFTAKSVVLAPQLHDQGKWIDLPRDAYRPIAQGAVILRHGQQHQPELAERFYDFLYGPAARAILERYGYLLP